MTAAVLHPRDLTGRVLEEKGDLPAERHRLSKVADDDFHTGLLSRTHMSTLQIYFRISYIILYLQILVSNSNDG